MGEELLEYNPNDGVYRSSYPIERVTGGRMVVDSNHAQVHGGNAFSMYHEALALAAAAKAYVEITVPADTYVHFQAASFFSTGYAQLRLVELAGPSTGGTGITPINRHRIINDTSVLTVKHGVTPAADDVVMDTLRVGKAGVGASGRIGGATGDDTEWVLNPATSYLLEITNNDSAAIDTTVRGFWYEEAGA